MKNFVKLVNFEMNRFAKVYFTLMLMTAVLQFTAIFLEVYGYVKRANELMFHESLSKLEYVKEYGTISLVKCFQTMWFMGPIALCAAAILFYIFLIWYRDWFGKHTFIYRLLMLPTERLNVFLAKAASILIMVLGFVALQVILLPVERLFFNSITPSVYRLDMTVVEAVQNFDYLQLLLPNSAIDFLLYYGLGISAVLVVFTAILFERSFRIKGIVLGVLYCILALAVFLAPILISEWLIPGYLYPVELLWAEIIVDIVIAACSILLGGYLIKNKITV
ncbi:hypothetical protein [Heyndrickxia acidiproducens]|uniref:hypothetical protein n=1 Tax=Heyndrickxia acidiproducens TaxID=1121084 RepID=UPI00036FA0DD|nr:hypothetical protein [Heyndrickxia acidiproducens]